MYLVPALGATECITKYRRFQALGPLAWSNVRGVTRSPSARPSGSRQAPGTWATVRTEAVGGRRHYLEISSRSAGQW